MNHAENKGSEAYHGWEVAKRIGVPTAKSHGGVRLNKIGLWPNGYAIWREAMEYRVSGYRYSPANTIDPTQRSPVVGFSTAISQSRTRRPSAGYSRLTDEWVN